MTGTVVDENGLPVIGANIVEKGTANGTITDIDGRFSISVGKMQYWLFPLSVLMCKMSQLRVNQL